MPKANEKVNLVKQDTEVINQVSNIVDMFEDLRLRIRTIPTGLSTSDMRELLQSLCIDLDNLEVQYRNDCMIDED